MITKRNSNENIVLLQELQKEQWLGCLDVPNAIVRDIEINQHSIDPKWFGKRPEKICKMTNPVFVSFVLTQSTCKDLSAFQTCARRIRRDERNDPNSAVTNIPHPTQSNESEANAYFGQICQVQQNDTLEGNALQQTNSVEVPSKRLLERSRILISIKSDATYRHSVLIDTDL
jgi:hypothetical protein